MKTETRYRYQKQIKELEEENKRLKNFRRAFLNVFNTACDCADGTSYVKTSYILKQAKEVME